MIRIIRWFRKRYLFFRYKFNITHKPIPLKETDRGFGLSTLIMFDSLRTGIPILVTTKRIKNLSAHKMFLIGQLGFAPCYTEKYIMDNLLISTSEILRGVRIPKIYVDDSCGLDDVEGVREYLSCEIENGFVRAR